jgi:hypothetical protein
MHGQGLPICEDERPAPAYLAALVCKARCCTSPNSPSQSTRSPNCRQSFCPLPASSRHPSTEKPTCTVHTPQIQRPQSAASATDPPPSAHPPDLAVSVVARGHPTEASLQLLALEARLPFVARASLHKSKKGSSFRSWPPYSLPPPLWFKGQPRHSRSANQVSRIFDLLLNRGISGSKYPKKPL